MYFQDAHKSDIASITPSCDVDDDDYRTVRERPRSAPVRRQRWNDNSTRPDTNVQDMSVTGML